MYRCGKIYKMSAYGFCFSPYAVLCKRCSQKTYRSGVKYTFKDVNGFELQITIRYNYNEISFYAIKYKIKKVNHNVKYINKLLSFSAAAMSASAAAFRSLADRRKLYTYAKTDIELPFER